MLTTNHEHAALRQADLFSVSNRLLQHLTSYEFDHLVNALRRDMRTEEALAHNDSEWAEHHRRNSRKSQDLLEMLNPKHCQI